MNNVDRSTGLKAVVTPDARTGEYKGLPDAQQGGDNDEFAEVLHLLGALEESKLEMLARSLHLDSPVAARDFFCINPHLFHASLISHEAKDEEFRERKRLRLAQQEAKFEEFARSLHFDSPDAARAFFCINPNLHYDLCRSRKRPRAIGETEEAAHANEVADARPAFQNSILGSRSPADAVAVVKASAEKADADGSWPKFAITAACDSVQSLASRVLRLLPFVRTESAGRMPEPSNTGSSIGSTDTSPP